MVGGMVAAVDVSSRSVIRICPRNRFTELNDDAW